MKHKHQGTAICRQLLHINNKLTHHCFETTVLWSLWSLQSVWRCMLGDAEIRPERGDDFFCTITKSDTKHRPIRSHRLWLLWESSIKIKPRLAVVGKEHKLINNDSVSEEKILNFITLCVIRATFLSTPTPTSCQSTPTSYKMLSERKHNASFNQKVVRDATHIIVNEAHWFRR